MKRMAFLEEDGIFYYKTMSFLLLEDGCFIL